MTRLPILSMTALLLAAFLAGCGKGGADAHYKATGKLTNGGEPLKNVRVTFVPTSNKGTASSGVTNDQGEFTLTSQKGQEGVVAGSYKVVLAKEASPDAYGPKPKRRKKVEKLPFPKEYTDPSKSPKQIEVEQKNGQRFEIDVK